MHRNIKVLLSQKKWSPFSNLCIPDIVRNRNIGVSVLFLLLGSTMKTILTLCPDLHVSRINLEMCRLKTARFQIIPRKLYSTQARYYGSLIFLFVVFLRYCYMC